MAGLNLATPPPSSALMPGGTGAGNPAPLPEAGLSDLSGSKAALSGITKLADQVVQSIDALASTMGMAPEAAKKLDQARSLLLDAVALYATSAATDGSFPMTTGSSFPGGGPGVPR